MYVWTLWTKLDIFKALRPWLLLEKSLRVDVFIASSCELVVHSGTEFLGRPEASVTAMTMTIMTITHKTRDKHPFEFYKSYLPTPRILMPPNNLLMI